MSNVLLSMRGVSISFGGLAAVQSVDMDLQEGIVTALAGPNGAGKTTLFNLITGNLPASSGQISLRGKSILGLRPHQIAGMGIARSFQDLRLFTHMTVRDNVLVAIEPSSWLWQPGGRAAQRERMRRVDEALEQTGLAGMADSRAIDLSYAETKFLSLARIIATGSRIWLLDEPASGLDVNSRTRFISLLRDATRRGVTICLIEHNLDVMTEIADRIAFLDRGRKLAEDVPEKVLRDPELISIYFGKSR
ncbi:ABC transporter ATP-binding protein [Parapusillimonas granuli]|uniref:ABC transporter ATP-binding protein n=1 Tax=Parapusillimonas granuli TaxID=380911 RepID=A0A853FT44_9BURK|nr:ABC transporter ATP-binding protein [Parapusillimonas granuli]MBB5216169.1 ABC-type branched-subunit amino acid transport system ATPase component [Parapusillimonas granuli]MEB2400444.1 ABC transporter ATP-binding protein [Alcaligenaceae bacterium]NYT47848.1 ABC transporter ATP-binding protein [Parapusillimonas granuli]